jgi:hypothetical protein
MKKVQAWALLLLLGCAKIAGQPPPLVASNATHNSTAEDMVRTPLRFGLAGAGCFLWASVSHACTMLTRVPCCPLQLTAQLVMAALETVVDRLAGNYTAAPKNHTQLSISIPMPTWITEADTPFLYSLLNDTSDGVDLNGGWVGKTSLWVWRGVVSACAAQAACNACIETYEVDYGPREVASLCTCRYQGAAAQYAICQLQPCLCITSTRRSA